LFYRILLHLLTFQMPIKTICIKEFKTTLILNNNMFSKTMNGIDYQYETYEQQKLANIQLEKLIFL
jgi:hypothetical protein